MRYLVQSLVLAVFAFALLATASTAQVADDVQPFPSTSPPIAETDIAFDPDDPDVLLAAGMRGNKVLVSWSLDGGDTWEEYEPTGIDNTRADPSVAIRRRDGLWIVTFVNLESRVGAIVSPDSGQTWTSPFAIHSLVNEPQDFPKVVVDNDPSSPGYGDIYMAWYARTWSDESEPMPTPPPKDGFEDPRIEIFWSDYNESKPFNGATIWNKRANVGGNLVGLDDYDGVQFPSLAMGLNGEIYLAFALRDFTGGDRVNGIGFATGLPDTSDQHAGPDWQTSFVAVDSVIGPFTDGVAPDVPDWGTVICYPTLAVDHSDGPRRGTVYLSWLGLQQDDGWFDIRMTSDVPAARSDPEFTGTAVSVGENATHDQFCYDTACDPSTGTYFVLRYDRRNDTENPNQEAEVILSASADGGSTWLDTVVSDPGVSFTDPDTLDHGREYIGVDAQHSLVATLWADARSDNWDIYFSLVGQFTNRSSDTGYAYTGTPYAAITIDFDDDGGTGSDDDLLITDATDFVGLMRNSANSAQKNDVPKLENVAGDEFPSVPTSNRGASAADYDNDGLVDLFLSSRSAPKIYRNTGSSPHFADYTTSVGASFSTSADSSWCGAWGDYDRDGDLDLYVGRAAGSGAQVGGALEDTIFENINGSLERKNHPTGIANLTEVSTTTAAWADLTGDGSLDLFVGAAGDGQASQILVQDISIDPGDFTGLPDYTFAVADSLLPSSLDEIVGATWRDFDNDGDLDLLIAGLASGAGGSQVLWDDGSGDLASSTALGQGFAAKGLASLDFDLDGRSDVILAPETAATLPAVYRNTVNGVDVVFDDRSAKTGMGSATVADFRAILAADIAGPSHTPDGDPDVYLGRSASTNAVFYQNRGAGADLPTNRWLKVRLSSDRSNNRFGVGSVVKVKADGGSLTQTQIVDGGSGVGSQQPSTLLFGLGETTQDVKVHVTWPDGSQDSTVVDVNSLESVVKIDDDHDAGIVGSSIIAIGLVGPGGYSDWVFEWETDNVCDPSQTKVIITGESAPRGETCPTPSPVGTVLTSTTYGVVVQMFADPDGTGYIHRVIWSDRPCGHQCTYDYTVENAVNSNGDGWQEVEDNEFSLSPCIN